MISFLKIKPVEWMIALRFMRSKRKDNFISVVSAFSLIGITLGVATLIIVMSVMNGYHTEFVRNILGIQGHLTAVYNQGKFPHYIEFADQVEKIKAVDFAAPIIVEQSMIMASNRATGSIVRGIEPEKLGLKLLTKDAITLETLNRFKQGEGVILGISLAEQLRVNIDDIIKIVAPETSSTLLGTIPRSKSFKVVGVFDVGLYQYNSSTIFMPLADAQALYRFSRSVSEIEIMLNDPSKIDEIKAQVAQIAGDNIRIVDWQVAQGKWLNALKVERNVMFLILTLIILVAVFNIISSLIMLVKDKSKSIAILRTMGASRASLIRIFMLCGSLIGCIGTVAGMGLGIVIAANIDRLKRFLEKFTGSTLFDPVIYFLTHLPSEIQISNIILISGLSLGFALLATIYPAYRAASLSPTEVLRYE